MSDKIALCRMFSGEYWKNPNNIGHESINIFLPDEKKGKENISYMYLPASGDYDINNIEIKYVLLTQHIAKKLKETGSKKKNKKGECIDEKNAKTIVKVIGLAKVEEELLKKDYNHAKKVYAKVENKKILNYKCIGGTDEFAKMQKIYLEKEKSNALYSKAEVLAYIHKQQEQRAKEIKYSGKTLDDIFENNTSFGDLNILMTLAVKDLSFPAQNIYLTNDKELFSSFISKGDKVIEIESNPSSQKQTTYIDCDEKLITDLFKFCDWEKAQYLNVDKFKKGFEPSFLTIIKKENDELSYSNMFAYLFNHMEFCKKFFKDLCEIDIEPLEVAREESNVDIIVKCKDRVIVIENKIESALNGYIEEDANGEKFKNQLCNYYKYIEKKYPHKDEKGNSLNRYFVFAPDYNPIKKENFGEVDGKCMKYVWNVVRYSEIDRTLDEQDFLGAADEWYFREFKKAIAVHTVDRQDYYREMQIRMRKLFN